MGLVPVTGVLAAVMKVADTDPETAVELVRLGLYESLCDQIDFHRPALEADAVALIDSRIAKARATMLRTTVGKALSGQELEDVVPYAEGLAVLEEFVEKGIGDILSGAALAFFNRQHPRDKRGQFVSASTSQGVDRDHEPQTRRAAHIANAKNIVEGWKSQGLADDNAEVTLHYQKIDPMTGKPVAQEPTQLPANVSTLGEDLERYDKTERGQRLLVGVSLTRGAPSAKVKNQGAMDALSMVTNDPKSLGLGARLINQVPNTGDWDSAANQWNDSSRPGDRQGYRRLKLTGQALGAVSQDGSPGAMLGGLAQLVGDLGPEAEKVLGPGFTRAAYRYRGTERKPSRELTESVEYANNTIATLTGTGAGSDHREQLEAGIRRRAAGNKEEAASHIAEFYLGENGTRDQLELRASGDVAAAILQRDLPDPKIAALSLASGEIPPSEGVIIDADGHVVSQAQGFKGDHYLPFDLKNLKRLRGGQYVRTRLSGGPTTEDVYTGLLTGARQIQVVSHSGVYTVEFDPDLRGGRRYSDKARKMVGRYEALLSVLASQSVVREDLAPDEVARLKRQAYGDANWDPEQGEANFQAELKRMKLQASVGMDEEDIESEATARAKEQPDWARASSSQRGQIKREQMGAVRDRLGSAAYRMYRLDGPGYFGALKALKQEFPYYIRDVKWEPLPQFLEQRNLPRGDRPTFGPPDRGYVAPDKLHAFDQGRGTGRTSQEGDQSAAGTAGAPGRPVAGAAAASQAPAKSVTDYLTPDSKASRQLAIALNGALRVLAAVPVPEEMDHKFDRADAVNSPPLAYTKWAWQNLFNGDAHQMANDMLSGKLTDKEVEHVKNAMRQLPGHAFGEQYGDSMVTMNFDPERTEQAAANVEEFTELISPFAKLSADPVLADTLAGKPQPFPDIITLTTPEKQETFLRNMGHRDQPLVAAINQAIETGEQPLIRDINATVEALRAKPEDKTVAASLLAKQKAWTFLKVRDLSEQLESLGLLTDDAGPKAPTPGPDEPKPLVKRLSHGSLRPLLSQSSEQSRDNVRKFLESLL